jgi:hypothetical protein
MSWRISVSLLLLNIKQLLQFRTGAWTDFCIGNPGTPQYIVF